MPFCHRFLSVRLGKIVYHGLEERGSDISPQMAHVSLEVPGMALGDPEGIVTGAASGAGEGQEGGRKEETEQGQVSGTMIHGQTP